MAILVRNAEEAVYALVAAHNQDQQDEVENETTFPHADKTSTQQGDYKNPVASPLLVTAANATTLATTIALANQCMNILDIHMADVLAHAEADETNTLGLVDLASDAIQDDTNVRLNLIKVACLAHVDETDVHYTDDSTNTVAAADATDAGSSQTLATAIKTFINAHVIMAPAAPLIKFGAF